MMRVSSRFLWFLMLCFMVNFIDRTNIGFAALTMNKDLGLTPTVFGLAGSALSFAYLLCEIPSNLILERVGARKWLARIMVTWGLASAGCAFVSGPVSLILMRMLVGIAEAGFAPGLVLFITYWYPQYRRASVQTIPMIGQPIAGMIGALLGGFILQNFAGIWGLAGWRWLFLLEGAPSVLLGIMMYFYIADRPKDAKFLSAEEKKVLIEALARDEEEQRRAQPATPKRSVTRQILSRNMLLISFAYACLIATFSALTLWTPQIVRGMSSSMPLWLIGVLVAVPPACSILWMIYWTRRSDRRKERFWHCVAPMLVGAAGWTVAALSSDPAVQLAGLVFASAFCLSAWPVFFTTPSILLPVEARAAGLAFLNTIGIVGSTISPSLVGYLRQTTGGFTVPMLAIASLLVIGVVLMLLVPRRILDRTAEAVPAAA